MHIYSFEKLEAWQLSRILRKEIYIVAKKFPKEETYGLGSQIRRSSSSIGDGLAEGSGRITSKDKAHFMVMSYASALETLNHIIGALDLQYISQEEYEGIRKQIEIITSKISNLRKSILTYR